MPTISKIDTRRTRPHVRHHALISEISVFGEGVKIYKNDIAATKCGKYIVQFGKADNLSLDFTDGSVYSVECPKCFPITEGEA